MKITKYIFEGFIAVIIYGVTLVICDRLKLPIIWTTFISFAAGYLAGHIKIEIK